MGQFIRFWGLKCSITPEFELRTLQWSRFPLFRFANLWRKASLFRSSFLIFHRIYATAKLHARSTSFWVFLIVIKRSTKYLAVNHIVFFEFERTCSGSWVTSRAIRLATGAQLVWRCPERTAIGFLVKNPAVRVVEVAIILKRLKIYQISYRFRGQFRQEFMPFAELTMLKFFLLNFEPPPLFCILYAFLIWFRFRGWFIRVEPSEHSKKKVILLVLLQEEREECLWAFKGKYMRSFGGKDKMQKASIWRKGGKRLKSSNTTLKGSCP